MFFFFEGIDSIEKANLFLFAQVAVKKEVIRKQYAFASFFANDLIGLKVYLPLKSHSPEHDVGNKMSFSPQADDLKKEILKVKDEKGFSQTIGSKIEKKICFDEGMPYLEIGIVESYYEAGADGVFEVSLKKDFWENEKKETIMIPASSDYLSFFGSEKNLVKISGIEDLLLPSVLSDLM